MRSIDVGVGDVDVDQPHSGVAVHPPTLPSSRAGLSSVTWSAEWAESSQRHWSHARGSKLQSSEFEYRAENEFGSGAWLERVRSWSKGTARGRQQ